MIITRNGFGGVTEFNTTQTALNAARTDTSKPWSDAEVQLIVAAQVTTRFPTVTVDAVLHAGVFSE